MYVVRAVPPSAGKASQKSCVIQDGSKSSLGDIESSVWVDGLLRREWPNYVLVCTGGRNAFQSLMVRNWSEVSVLPMKTLVMLQRRPDRGWQEVDGDFCTGLL